MKLHRATWIGLAAIIVTVPATLLPLNSVAQSQQASQTQQSSGMRPIRGKREAMRMVPARAELLHTLDADKMKQGYTFDAKLVQKVRLDSGPQLPSGTILHGTVENDDMHVQGEAKLALRFTAATLKSGKTVPIKATIVGIQAPETTGSDDYPIAPGDEVPNSWTDGTLQVDQIGVSSGVDLHSKISSKNSGVFVSKDKHNVTLREGSEIELAIAAKAAH